MNEPSLIRHRFCLFTVGLALGSMGCGGSQQAPTVRDESVSEQPETVADAPQPEQATVEPEPVAPEPTPEPATFSHDGITPEDANAVRTALVAAGSSQEAFLALVDPQQGLGAIDTTEGTRGHYCDVERMAQESALGFTVREEDEWQCDDPLKRCYAKDPHDGSGTVFYFSGELGSARHLSTVVRYGRQAPRRDSESVVEFVNSASEVCDLWRSLSSADSLALMKITVFESRFTERADEESNRTHHCGEEAERAAREHLEPLIQTGPPAVCERAPLSCSWFENHEVRVLSGPRGPWAVAYLGVDLRESLKRFQGREVEGLPMRARRHRCGE